MSVLRRVDIDNKLKQRVKRYAYLVVYCLRTGNCHGETHF